MTIVLVDLIVVTLLGSLLLFLKKEGKPDKRTGWHALVLAVVALATGAFQWLLYQKLELPVHGVFAAGVAVFLAAGWVHAETLYGLLWARRDKHHWERDSLAKETGFTFGLSSVMALLSIGLLGYLTGKWEVAASMWGLVLAFPLPFVLVKAFDALTQVPPREFEKKWFYETFPFDPEGWPRENMVSVGFVVADSLQHEGKWFRTKARFSIVIPRDQELRFIYRVALRQYHAKNPSVPVQELGYEEGIPPFWWLFTFPVVWWNPLTWFRSPRYLDPTETIANNHLRNGDFIAAVRMPAG